MITQESEEEPTQPPAQPSLINGTTPSPPSSQEHTPTIVNMTANQSPEAEKANGNGTIQQDDQSETKSAEESHMEEQLLKAQAEWDAVGTIQPGKRLSVSLRTCGMQGCS